MNILNLFRPQRMAFTRIVPTFTIFRIITTGAREDERTPVDP